MTQTSKEDLIALLNSADLSPEAIEDIEGVIAKHTGKIHDEAIATTDIEESSIEDTIKEIFHQMNTPNDGGIQRPFTVKAIAEVLQSIGIDSRFRSIEINGPKRSIAILVEEKNWKKWAIPDPRAKLKDLGKYFDYFGDKEAICGASLNRPATGEMLGGQFVVTKKGRLGNDSLWEREERKLSLAAKS